MRSARSPILGNPDRLQEYPTRTGKKNPKPARPPTRRRFTLVNKDNLKVIKRRRDDFTLFTFYIFCTYLSSRKSKLSRNPGFFSYLSEL